MRLRPFLVLASSILSATVVTACGDDGGSTASTTPDTTVVTSTTAEWQKPSVSIPKTIPDELVVTTLIPGHGEAATTGSTVIVHYVGVRTATGQEFDNSFDRGQPFPVVLGVGRVIQGWDEGLIGIQTGERRQLDIPAGLAYGDEPQGDVIQAGDALTFVVDAVAVLPSSSTEDQPDVTIDPRDNGETLTSEDLVVGQGATLAEGQHAAIHIVVSRADTGALLESTWGHSLMTFTVGATTEIFPIFVDAVRGMNVGGRRLVQMPFAEVWDGAGNDDLGLPAGIDIVVVIDLVGAY